MASSDPVLTRLRNALSEKYGDRIERVVLYGSRARGEARPDSDYDIAVFLNNFTSCAEEFRQIADIELAMRNHTESDINAMPFPAGSWCDPASPLMYEIRKDGLDL
jgi:predicted nucleotidyltransferase